MPLIVLRLYMQMAGCVYLFMLLRGLSVWEKLLSTVGIDEEEIRMLSGLG